MLRAIGIMTPMNTQANARQIHNTATALRNGKITADEYRARMRTLRESIGQEAYDTAKVWAVAAMNHQ